MACHGPLLNQRSNSTWPVPTTLVIIRIWRVQNIRQQDQRQHESHPRARGCLGVRDEPTPRCLYIHDRVAPLVKFHLLVLHTTSPAYDQFRRRKGGTTGHARSQTVDVTHDAHPLSQPPSHVASPPPSLARITHTRRANGFWANDSIHLRAALVIPDGREPVPKTMHARARTSVDRDPPRSVEHAHAPAPTSTATDVAASFSLTLPRLRLSLDREAPSESDAEHELLPLPLSARRPKFHPQLSMTTANKQPSPIRGMVLTRPVPFARFSLPTYPLWIFLRRAVVAYVFLRADEWTGARDGRRGSLEDI
ncbi:hypothetical protein AURDEDRAFT_166326 [Auricularia subglabra TFB-10046 SS5]|uniref:Uncharacterized protein n=1 Tax=Auricularia subglabra (strain TFB-10046 / SS5) TaxID=717982 RepID=J0D327_AURST|nr:hypothetical protein AURDEDRAFT_166326 [Auricularia subglabra TFB-10046 SS5]